MVDGAGVHAQLRLPRRDQHDDLLERGVAGTLADPVDSALHLPRTRQHAGDRVRDRQAEVVVAVDRQHDVAQTRHQLVQPAQEGRVLVRHRVADCVGDVDRGRALVDRDLQHLGRELDVRARRVHRRELDVVAQRLRVSDRGSRHPLDVLARVLHLVLDVDVGGRDECVDTGALGVLERAPRGVDVTREGACEPRDHRPVDLARDALDGLEVTGRGDREAGLDHVHAQTRELLRDLELLLRVQRDARRLLAVAQRRVEDDYSVRVLRWRHTCASFALVQLLLGLGSRLHAAAGALFPPEGEEKKSKVEGERHRQTGYR